MIKGIPALAIGLAAITSTAPALAGAADSTRRVDADHVVMPAVLKKRVAPFWRSGTYGSEAFTFKGKTITVQWQATKVLTIRDPDRETPSDCPEDALPAVGDKYVFIAARVKTSGRRPTRLPQRVELVRQATQPDGSRVTLNRESIVVYPGCFPKALNPMPEDTEFPGNSDDVRLAVNRIPKVNGEPILSGTQAFGFWYLGVPPTKCDTNIESLVFPDRDLPATTCLPDFNQPPVLDDFVKPGKWFSMGTLFVVKSGSDLGTTGVLFDDSVPAGPNASNFNRFVPIGQDKGRK